MTQSAFLIEVLEREHYDQVASLTSLTQSHVELDAERAKPYSEIWVARSSPGAAPQCYALVWRVADELQIVDVATRPDARRAGAARALLSALLTAGARHGSARALLEVRENNVPARSLYASLGFAVVRVRPRYYADGESACEMELSLAQVSAP